MRDTGEAPERERRAEGRGNETREGALWKGHGGGLMEVRGECQRLMRPSRCVSKIPREGVVDATRMRGSAHVHAWRTISCLELEACVRGRAETATRVAKMVAIVRAGSRGVSRSDRTEAEERVPVPSVENDNVARWRSLARRMIQCTDSFSLFRLV